MILLTISNSETILLIVLGLIGVVLLGWLIVTVTKNKMEKELDLVSIETMLDKKEEPVKVSKIETDKEEESFDIEDMLIEEDEDVKVDDNKTSKVENPISEIEAVLAKMQSDLDKERKAAISTFEEEQEEKSIISYQELKAAKDKIVPYADEIEENQIVYNKSLKVEIPNDYQEPTLVKEEKPVKKTTHFSNSGFISPVYGRLEEKKLEYPTIPSFKDEIDMAIDEPEIPEYEPLTVDYDAEPVTSRREINNNHRTEVKDSRDFLNELKNFRDNLE